MSLADRIQAALHTELPAAVELRHRLHAAPHLSGSEGPTAAVVADALGWGHGLLVAGTGRLLGPGGTGTSASAGAAGGASGGVSGRTGAPAPGAVALRAELDALPITEATGVPWSATGAAMHACGHDVHLAAAVAAARAIAACEPETPVAVLLQPREEAPPSGAHDVVESGILTERSTKAVVAAHVQPQLPAGVVGVTPGLVNASVDEFEIVVQGHAGHAGYPQTVRDPIVALAAVVLALQQIASRRVDPVYGAVCTVGQIAGGTAANVVPGTAHAIGTLRLMRPTDRTAMMAALGEIARGTAQAWGCTAEVIARSGEPALCNDPALATGAAAHLVEAGIPVDVEWRSFGADDFSYYGAQRPALMAFVGVDGGAGLHESEFLPPDSTVALVAQALVAGYLAAAELP